MNNEQFIELIEKLFGILLKQYNYGEEYALYNFGPEVIHRIGYATNITPELIEQAAQIQQSIDVESRSLPGVGELEFPINFQEMSERVSTVHSENIKSWKNSEKPIKRVGFVTGAGNSLEVTLLLRFLV